VCVCLTVGLSDVQEIWRKMLMSAQVSYSRSVMGHIHYRPVALLNNLHW